MNNKKSHTIKVEAHAGYKANERPTAIILGERRLHVEEILDRWYGPGYEYFKLKAEDENTYVIKYDIKEDIWELSSFRKANS